MRAAHNNTAISQVSVEAERLIYTFTVDTLPFSTYGNLQLWYSCYAGTFGTDDDFDSRIRIRVNGSHSGCQVPTRTFASVAEDGQLLAEINPSCHVGNSQLYSGSVYLLNPGGIVKFKVYIKTGLAATETRAHSFTMVMDGFNDVIP